MLKLPDYGHSVRTRGLYGAIRMGIEAVSQRSGRVGICPALASGRWRHSFSQDPKKISADRSVHEYEQAGVRPSKIALDVPFYGHVWGEVPDGDHGLFGPGKTVPGAFGHYGNISASTLNSGFTRYWDPSDVQTRRANDHRLRKRRDGR